MEFMLCLMVITKTIRKHIILCHVQQVENESFSKILLKRAFIQIEKYRKNKKSSNLFTWVI